MSRGCAHWGMRVSTDATPILNVHQPGTLVLQEQCSIQLYCQVLRLLHKVCVMVSSTLTHTCTPIIKHSVKYTHLHIYTNHKTTWCQVHSLTHLHQSQNNMVPSILTHSHNSGNMVPSTLTHSQVHSHIHTNHKTWCQVHTHSHQS